MPLAMLALKHLRICEHEAVDLSAAASEAPAAT
jgi:hypothetical protein